MSTAELDHLIEQVKALSPAERGQLRQVLDGLPTESPEQALDRKLRESGLVRNPPHQGPRRQGHPPVKVEGKPLSEQLIEERR